MPKNEKTMWGTIIDDATDVQKLVDKYVQAKLVAEPNARLSLDSVETGISEWLTSRSKMANQALVLQCVLPALRRLTGDSGLDLTVQDNFVGYIGVKEK